jgi:hypothetical protein
MQQRKIQQEPSMEGIISGAITLASLYSVKIMLHLTSQIIASINELMIVCFTW